MPKELSVSLNLTLSQLQSIYRILCEHCLFHLDLTNEKLLVSLEVQLIKQGLLTQGWSAFRQGLN